jgi:hypothetical protein
MGVEDGTYQVLQARLADRAAELGRRAEELNTRRREVFGEPVLELTGSARPRTAAASTVCGIVAVRTDALLLGTSAPGPAEGMLSLHGPDGAPLEPSAVPGLLDDERYLRDLAELLRYYRDARLTDLVRTASARLLAVFRTGENEGDIRVLQWQLTDGRAEYLDNHGERELPSPPAFELPWTTVGREHHDQGRFRIEGGEGSVSVATTGGSLTVRALPGDRPLFEEPVDDPLQSLADAGVSFAEAGPLLLLRIRPYNEQADRYLVVNTRTGSVRRQDSLARGARLLPAEQGLIFPGGYELADGSHRAFRIDGTTGPASAADELRFDAVIASPNGEDLLYVLRRPGGSRTLLLPWNTVRREAAASLQGAGCALLPDGTLVLLKPDREPVRTHELQLWNTPYLSAEYAAAQPVGDGPLERIGNVDLVRGIADCLEVVRSATAAEPDPALILDSCAKAGDRHYWLGDTGLLEPLAELSDAAEQLAAERTRIGALAARAARALEQAGAEASALVRRSHGEPPTDAEGWTALLADLRRAQGRTRSLSELPQLDPGALESVETVLADELAAATERAFAYFAGPDAFAAPLAAARSAADTAAGTATAAEAAQLAERLAEQAEALATVTDLVTGSTTADPGAGTAVLLAIGEVLAAVNRARAVLDGRRRALLDSEHRAAYAAESALLAQATTAALAAADSPAGCDDPAGLRHPQAGPAGRGRRPRRPARGLRAARPGGAAPPTRRAAHPGGHPLGPGRRPDGAAGRGGRRRTAGAGRPGPRPGAGGRTHRCRADGPAHPARPGRPLRRRRCDGPPRPPPLRGPPRTGRADPAAGGRGPGLRGHRHRLPPPRARPRAAGRTRVLDAATGERVARAVPRGVPRGRAAGDGVRDR